MEFFKHLTHIDFLGARKWTATLSILLLLASVFSLFYYGLNWGLDFTGGTQIQLSFPTPVSAQELEKSLHSLSISKIHVQTYGAEKDIIINIPAQNININFIKQKINLLFSNAEIKRIETLGPSVGKELARKGVIATLVALLAIAIYVTIRFEYRFALGAIVALIHDPILILGVFSYYQLEFNLITLGALLAVLGYSLNDTIVIFDRVRENFQKMQQGSTIEIMNLSINQTLSRTIMTSMATLLVVLALFFYGGEMIHNFATALIIGIVVGTYSSIYIAGALAVALRIQRSDFIPKPRQNLIDHQP